MRARVGAFPSLGPGPGPQSGGGGGGSSSSSSTPPSRASTPASSEPHKVLTLHGSGAGRKAKKVTLASYTRSSPSTPRAPSPIEPAEVVWRAPPPPKEVVFAQGPRQPATLWVDLLGERVVYVDPPKTKPAPKPKQNRREGKFLIIVVVKKRKDKHRSIQQQGPKEINKLENRKQQQVSKNATPSAYRDVQSYVLIVKCPCPPKPKLPPNRCEQI